MLLCTYIFLIVVVCTIGIGTWKCLLLHLVVLSISCRCYSYLRNLGSNTRFCVLLPMFALYMHTLGVSIVFFVNVGTSEVPVLHLGLVGPSHVLFAYAIPTTWSF